METLGVEVQKFHKNFTSFHKTICCVALEEQRTSELKSRIHPTPKHQKEEVAGRKWKLLKHQGVSKWNHSFIDIRNSEFHLSCEMNRPKNR